MKFDITKSIEILERTPAVLQTMLTGLSDCWTTTNEGPDTWSAYDIVGHLIHGETTDWMQRLDIILGDGSDKTFEPFNRFAQFDDSKGKSLQQLLQAFADIRKSNIEKLKTIPMSETVLNNTGTHPTFGEVTLRQLLATWTVHDLSHISQIVRVMANQYKDEIGPWLEYINLLKKKDE